MEVNASRVDYILDTSAILSYLLGRKGAEKLAQLIPFSALPFLVFSELYYVIWKKNGKVEADKIFALVKSWNLPMLLPDERVILNAGRLKATYRLGFADSYIAAFAIDINKPLITSDRDYEVLKEELKTLYV